MKKTILSAVLLIGLFSGLVGCTKCKTCHPEIMGVKGPSKEMCGDELKAAEKTPGMVCE